MRYLMTALALCALSLGAACNPAVTTESTPAPATTTETTTSTNTSAAPSAPPNSVPPISAAHGNAAPSAAGANEKPEGVDTAALDDKIEKLEAKTKAGGATDTDKKTLAGVYLQRANIYRDAGSPRLYKFALGDYRHVLRYDPTNADARNKMDEIVAIYKSMSRPVPTNGLEP